MSTAIDATPVSISEQTATATRELCQMLGLVGIKPTEMKYLTLALAQAATDEAERNTAFAEQVRALYRQFIPTRPPKRAPHAHTESGRRQGQRRNDELVPIGTVNEALLDPYAPPNPWALQQLFGSEQLATVLNRYSPAKLKEALPLVQQRFPGTRPRAMTKSGIVSYIVEKVVGSA